MGRHLLKERSSKPRPKPKRFARWRVATLTALHVLIALHIAHWYVSGRTLAPLELNEVMHTLELGVITAGFILMAVALVSVVIFGRFFCSWACHILALQDLCAWMLRKIGLRPRPLRSRLLAVVPFVAMLYMFVWPQVARVVVRTWPSLEAWVGARPEFRLRVLGDGSGWASFVTDDFWRNLPGPTIAITTFLICGFAIVYVLGSRSFCAFGCPYGVIFGLADRVAPGRIKLTGDCIQCGTCTANCSSRVQVHKEIARYGKVVDSRCLRDLDCVSVCPESALSFGFTKPSLLTRRSPNTKPVREPADFKWPEEILMATVMVATIVVFRGLYDRVPFLMTLGLGAVFAYGSVLGLRLVRRRTLRFHGRALKQKGQWTRAGYVSGVFLASLAVLFVHSAFIRYHEAFGQRALAAAESSAARGEPADTHALAALASFRTCQRWGLVRPVELDRRLAWAAVHAGESVLAELHLQRVIDVWPSDLWANVQLGRLLAGRQRYVDAEHWLRRVLSFDPPSVYGEAPDRRHHASAHEILGTIAMNKGRVDAAILEYEAAVHDAPRRVSARLGLAELHANRGEFAVSLTHLREAVLFAPDRADVRYNLAVILGVSGHEAKAMDQYREAIRLDPTDPDPLTNLAYLLIQKNELDEAETLLRQAIEQDPRHAASHYNLGTVLLARDSVTAANQHFDEAGRIDARYRVQRDANRTPFMEGQ